MMMRVLIAIAVLCIATASAHVTIFPTTAIVGQRTYIYAQIPHSCNGANNSIGVSVRLPTNITAQPMTKEGFTLTRTMKTLDNGASQQDWVTWMASSATAPFPTWQLGLFGISITFPAAYFSVGRKVWFQTIQYCDGLGTQAQSNWTLVTSSIYDVDMAYAVLGETSPSVTVAGATTLVTYVNTTSYTTIDNSDDWTTDSTLSVIAIILAALAFLAFIFFYCSKPAASTSTSTKSAGATPQQVPATTFVANGV